MRREFVERAVERFGARFSLVERARHHDRHAPLVPTPVLALEPAPGILEIRLGGGERRNVLGRAAISRIESLIEFAPQATRVILLSADGPDFCAGYDLVEAKDDPAALLAHEANLAVLRTTAHPVVAALHGNVIGGGLELALTADVRIAARDTRFAIPACALGLVYSEAGARLLVDAVGESVARAMLVGGRRLSAVEALSLGLVSEVVAPEELESRAFEVVQEISGWSPVATAGNRQLLDVVTGRVVIDTAALRTAAFAPDGALARSIAAFIDRREHARNALVASRRIDVRRLGEDLLRVGREKSREFGRRLLPSH